MKNKNFITRGISKETGKFVYGYYFKMGSHYMYTGRKEIFFNKVGDEVERNILGFTGSLEITQQPDRFVKTIDGVDYYENDKIKIPFVYNDYQSSHPGYVDMYFHEIYYKEAIIVFNDESSQWVAEWERSVKYEGGNTEEWTGLTKDNLECLEYQVKEIAEEIEQKGEESKFSWEDDEELKEDVFENGIENYKVSLKIIGNTHNIVNPELMEKKK